MFCLGGNDEKVQHFIWARNGEPAFINENDYFRGIIIFRGGVEGCKWNAMLIAFMTQLFGQLFFAETA